MSVRLSLLTVALLCGCLDWDSVTRSPDAASTDARSDLPTEVAADVTIHDVVDASSDGSNDHPDDVPDSAAFDAPGDLAADASADVMTDVSADISRDSASDVAPDVAADVPVDVASDIALDASADVARDTPADVRADVASDVVDARDVDTCVAPRARCGAACLDLSADVRNCGACGRDCTSLPRVNASAASCVAGRCMISCAAGYGDCDRSADNGCEAALTTDASCGACGVTCGGSTHCASTGGAYSCACPAGENLCGSTCMNLTSDVANCGACGNRCATLTNAVTDCRSSRCVTTCYPGFRELGTARCADFGGATVSVDLSTATSTRCIANPLTGDCGCAPGFRPQSFALAGHRVTSWAITAQTLTLCNDDLASAVGEWGGAFLVSSTGTCLTSNPLASIAAPCGCPSGSWDRTTFPVTLDAAGTTGTFAICTRRGFSGATTRTWLGAYAQYVDGWHTPGADTTATCHTPNPRTAACSCPAGASSVAVRVMGDGASDVGSVDHFAHMQIVLCMM